MLNEEFLENIVSNDEEKVLVALESINLFSNITYEEGELLFEILGPYLQSENEEIMISARKACSFLKSKFDFNTSEPEILSKEIQIDHTFKKITQNTEKSWSKILLFFFLFLFSIGFVLSFFSKKSERKEFVSQNLINKINSLFASQIRLNIERNLKQAHFIASPNIISEGFFGWDALGWFCAKETKLKKAIYRRYAYRNQDMDYTAVPKLNEEITLTYNAQGFPETEHISLTSQKTLSNFPGFATVKKLEYDNKNNITSEYIHRPLKNVTDLICKYSYSCVNGFTIVEANHKYNAIVYKFDTHGNILEAIRYSESGLIERKILFEYNLGRLVKKIVTFDSYSEETFYNYDSSGLLIEEVRYRKNQLVKQSSHVYDEKKQLISITQKTSDRSFLFKFQYNSQGLLTNKTIYLKHANDPTNKWFPEDTYQLESAEYFE